jgi:hypothetical protein
MEIQAVLVDFLTVDTIQSVGFGIKNKDHKLNKYAFNFM